MLENTTILHFVLLHQVPEHPTPPVALVHLPPLLLCWVRLHYQRLFGGHPIGSVLFLFDFLGDFAYLKRWS